MATRGEAAAGGAAVQRVGAAVCCAVERFVAVGENIADANPDVRHSMVLACKEARAAGKLHCQHTMRVYCSPDKRLTY